MSLHGSIITGIGIMFLFFGNLGVLRLPDVYNRVQAGTKCTTLGAFLTIIGVGIMEPGWFWKTLIIAVFILVTNPISSHAIARASLKARVALCDKTVVDKTEDFDTYREKA
jgi:multicomponent Na+:H+ antiporter subunit G